MNQRDEMVIWMRLGDNCEYEDHDDLQSVADTLIEHDVQHVARLTRFGITAPGFEGWDYISLYWGKDATEPVRELSRKELSELSRLLSA